MDITKPEFIISGSALLLVGGTTWYLNSKLDTFNETLQQLTDRFGTMVTRIMKHDDDGIITKSKLAEIENFSKQLKLLQSEFGQLKDGVILEFKNVDEIINKQNKKIKNIDKRLDLIYQSVGLSAMNAVVVDKSEDEIFTDINPPIEIIKKKKPKNVKRNLLVDTDRTERTVGTERAELSGRTQPRMGSYGPSGSYGSSGPPIKDKDLEENVLAEMATMGM